jgi:hypothetical protein
LLISHPLPGDTVIQEFVAAQGSGDPAIRNLIGIIWGADSRVVAVAAALQEPPNWIIPFFDIPEGYGYCLEVIDANTKERLACSGPFDAVPRTQHGPEVFYPKANATVPTNVAPYGSWLGNAVRGKMVQGGNTIQDQAQTMGPPQSQYWTVSFGGLPQGAGYSFTAYDSVNPAQSTTVAGLTVQ